MRDFEDAKEELDKRMREKNRYVDLKEREFRALIINTKKEQTHLESDINYYQDEVKMKRQAYDLKRAELVFELQETNRKLEVERRSHQMIADTIEIMKRNNNT